MGDHLRFRVDPRDWPDDKVARRLGLTPAHFREVLPELQRRGFPFPDPTTCLFDSKAVEEWMDQRNAISAPLQARDARTVDISERLARSVRG